MNELRSWVITIVTISVLCSIIESFAPKGSLNKYVKLICGLAVTTVIAMPVLNFLNRDFQLDTVAWNQYMRLSEGELKSRIEVLEKDDAIQTLELYRLSLINDIKARFKGQSEFVMSEVDAVLNENHGEENFGIIRCLYITLTPRNNNEVSKESLSYVRNQLMQTFAIEEDQILLNLSNSNGGK